MDIKVICKNVNSYLEEKDFPYSCHINMNSEGCLFLEMDIDCGDWKHEHLRAMWLVNEYLTNNGYEYIHQEIPRNENEYCDDTYDATHRWHLGDW